MIPKVRNSISATGFDPFTFRNLRRLALQAGFTNVEVAIEPCHRIVGFSGESKRRQGRTKLENAPPSINKALGGEVAFSRHHPGADGFLRRPLDAYRFHPLHRYWREGMTSELVDRESAGREERSFPPRQRQTLPK